MSEKQVTARFAQIQQSKEKRIQAPKFIYGKQKEMYFTTRRARNTTSLLQAPEFIYGA